METGHSPAKAPIAFHTPLFALHTPLGLYAANVSLVPWSDVAGPCILFLGASVLLWLLAGFLLRDIWRGALAATTISLFALYFGPAVGEIKSVLTRADLMAFSLKTPQTVWTLFAVAAVAMVLRAKRSVAPLTVFLNVAALGMFAFAVSSIALSHWRINRELQSFGRKHLAVERSAAPRPDVFYLVLDGYGRTDTFERLFDFSDSAFVSELESLGFYVASRAHANYVQTELSLASTLNLVPVQDFRLSEGKASDSRALLDEKIDDSEVARTFRSLGYKYVAITTGFPALAFEHADHRIEQSPSSTLYWNALLEKTPFAPSAEAYATQYDTRRRILNGSFRSLQNIAAPTGSPRFVILHLLAPHPPFVFGPNGETRRPRMSFAYVDGNHYTQQGGTLESYRTGYRDQAQYVARRILESVRALVEKNPNAVIILQGDHGPKSRLDQDSSERTDLREAFAILSAIRAPAAVTGRFHERATPVNTFRAVLGGLFGLDLPGLPDRSYYSTWQEPLVFLDVTDRLEDYSEDSGGGTP